MNNNPENKAFLSAFSDFLSSANPECRVRLAPTPSGFLHLGNAFNFILNALTALSAGGKIWLRIDDLDADRKRPEYLEDIFESLHWLGINWHEGPGLAGVTPAEQIQDFENHWSQHLRLKQSFVILERLRAQDLLFPCRISRSQLAAYGGTYPVHLRQQGLSLDAPDVAWRIKTEGLDPSMQDFLVRRRDGLPAYQVASLADDLYFGITHIVRGADLQPSTQAQLYLAKCLGEDRFLKINFLHHPLILDEAGQKLSKSAGASSLQAMRQVGQPASDVYRMVSRMLGISPVEDLAGLCQLVNQGLIKP